MHNRHDLVWIENKITPFIVTKQTVTDSKLLNVAECLSPAKSIRSRVATTIAKADIIKTEKPILFSEILKFEANESSDKLEKITNKCSDKDLVKISEILVEIEVLGLELRVFGSVAWQYLTHKPFINNKSDLDIVIYLNNIDQVEPINKLLIQLGNLLQRKIDGEFVLKNTYFMAINEWFNSATDILIKTNSDLLLLAKSEPILHEG